MIPTGRAPAPIGIITNPRSGRGDGSRADLEVALARRPGLLWRRFEDGSSLDRILADLGRREVALLVVDGGDGTVQGLLTALLESRAFPALPPVAILPGGTTNMTASDIGAGPRRAATLAWLIDAAVRCELGRYLVRRPVLKVAHAPGGGPAQRGLFFGAAGICDAIRLCVGSFHARGLGSAASSLATVLAVLGRALASGAEALELGGEEVGVVIDGASGGRESCSFALATTLDRLILRSRPFWNTQAGPVRFTRVTHPPVGLVRHALPLLYGGERRRLPPSSYRSTGARRIALDLATPFTIDGQFFTPQPGVPVVITAEETVPFVRLRR